MMQLSSRIRTLTKDYLAVCISLTVDNDGDTVTSGMVPDICDTLNLFILNKISDRRHQHGFIYHVGNLCDLDLMLILIDFSLCAYHNTSAACHISLIKACCSVNCCRCGEVRTLDMLHKIGNSCIGVIHKMDSTVNYLSKVMGRNICCHTYSDTYSTVYKKVRKS